MFILFDTIFILYSFVYLPYLLLTKRWHSDYAQRFGVFSEDMRARLQHRGRNIWVHAVSVGEVIVAESLIRRLRERWPGCAIVCSVTTKTGYELAQKRLGQEAIVIFSPLDLSFTVRSFVRLIQPKLYIVAETEIWPNLFRRLNKADVPIIIVNGRISDRSFGRYRAIKSLLKGILANVSVFAMQGDTDARRIKELGAAQGRVFTVGNIKFDDVADAVALPAPDPASPVWVAGSTHPGEEQIVLDAFKSISGWRLVIAPRHVERADEVMRLIVAAGFKAIKLSGLKGGHQGDEIVVVDAIGHLRDLYAASSLVFIGKSFRVGGGQNIIEPAALGKAVVVGPRMENFRDVLACFKDKDALVQVASEGEFAGAVKALVADGPRRNALGERARKVVLENQGAGNRTLELIKQWL